MWELRGENYDTRRRQNPLRGLPIVTSNHAAAYTTSHVHYVPPYVYTYRVPHTYRVHVLYVQYVAPQIMPVLVLYIVYTVSRLGEGRRSLRTRLSSPSVSRARYHRKYVPFRR